MAFGRRLVLASRLWITTCRLFLPARSFGADMRLNRERQGLQKHSKVRTSRARAVRDVERYVPENKPITAAVVQAGNARDWDGVLKAFEKAEEKSTILFNATIKAALLCDRLQDGQAFYEEMKRHGCQKTIPTYLAAMEIHAKLGNQDLVDEVWKELYSRGIPFEHRSIAYLAVMNSKAIAGDVRGVAEHLYQYTINDDVRPEITHFGAILKACAKAGDSATAKRVMYDIRSHSWLTMNVVVYTSFLQAICGDPLQDILEIRADMKARGVKPDDFFLTAYIQALLGKHVQALASDSQVRSIEMSRIRAVFAALEDEEHAGLKLRGTVKLAITKLRKINA